MPGTASPGVKRLMIWPSAGQCQLTPPAAREPPLATAGAGGGTASFGSPATGTSVLTAVAGAAATVGACTARAVAGPVAVDTWGLAGGAERSEERRVGKECRCRGWTVDEERRLYEWIEEG